MKIVRESIGDILKPKSSDEIRNEFKDIIFWKGVVDGKMSPEVVKYYLDKNFIANKAKSLGITFNPTLKWQKQLVYFIDILGENNSLSRELRNYISSLNVNKEPAAVYIAIKNFIEIKYKELNKKYSSAIGKNLREQYDGTIY